MTSQVHGRKNKKGPKGIFKSPEAYRIATFRKLLLISSRRKFGVGVREVANLERLI
jgi:hypothetical protein